jgi:serine protease Do
LSRSGGNQGIGFAVPVNLARSVMDRILNHGHAVRGYLGVVLQDLTSELASAFGLENGNGVLVSDVTADSAAEKIKGDTVLLYVWSKGNGRYIVVKGES